MGVHRRVAGAVADIGGGAGPFRRVAADARDREPGGVGPGAYMVKLEVVAGAAVPAPRRLGPHCARQLGPRSPVLAALRADTGTLMGGATRLARVDEDRATRRETPTGRPHPNAANGMSSVGFSGIAFAAV